MSNELASHYLEEACRQMRVAEAAMAQLRDEDLFFTLDPEAHSVAILVQHLAGNMRSRFTDFLTSDGEKSDRFRDREFELISMNARADLMRCWEDGWACVFAAIDTSSPKT